MVNQTVLDILKYLRDTKNPHINKYLKTDAQGASLNIDGHQLVKISPRNINLGSVNLQNKIKLKNKTSESDINILQTKGFISSIRDNLVGLNHLGVSYSCKDLGKEIESYRRAMQNTSFNVFEEQCDIPDQRWLFIGDKRKWSSPMFEVVLVESPDEVNNQWTPHFQIDLDTRLGIEELKKKSRQSFGKNHLTWQLDLPKFGTVLGMGSVGSVGGTKLYLGTGTSKRNSRAHRTYELKKL